MVMLLSVLLSAGPAVDLVEVRETVTREVSRGYGTRASLLKLAMMGVDKADEPKVAAVIDEVVKAQLTKERSWKGKTDNDRLTAAFKALEKQGVLAREFFSMTTTSGRADMKELAATMKPRPSGYVFFTPQDLDNVFDDKGVFLTFGADSIDDWAATGARVVAALEKEGLHPTWSGSELEKIWVPLTWRRRLTP